MQKEIEMFKCMLAAKPHSSELDSAMKKLRYPVMASPKIDGIRAMTQSGDLYARSLKKIPNVSMRKAWGSLPEGFDGEVVCGNMVASDVFNRSCSQTMSINGGLKGAYYCVFDVYHPTKTFQERAELLHKLIKKNLTAGVVFVEHELIKNHKELMAYEKKILGLGFEGICIRDPKGRYKQGRSTTQEGGLIAIKRVADAEATIISLYEQETNTNTAKKNELGRTARSHHKSGMVGKDTLGGFVVKSKLFPETFNVGTGIGLTIETRASIWKSRSKYVGKIIKFKYQDYSMKDKPRQPIFLGFRDVKDMS
jgi:DNA ligase-1